MGLLPPANPTKRDPMSTNPALQPDLEGRAATARQALDDQVRAIVAWHFDPATGCPFCRVMMTDGVDDVAATRDVEKPEVLDVAQLLLGSLDKGSVTLPEKGTAAKEAEERAARIAAEAV